MVFKGSPSATARIGADLWTLWEQAIPLHKARYRFGDKARVNEYSSLLNSKPGGFSVLGALGNFLADMAKTDAPIESNMRTTPEERHRFSELSSVIDDDCIERLQRRQLIALGFSIPRHPDDPPRVIPPEMLVLGRINFGGDGAAGEGLKFQAVRVIPAETMYESLPAPNRPGRPSNRALIKLAYEACSTQGLIDFHAPQIRAIEKIQAWLKTYRPEDFDSGRGLAVEAIRKVIAGDFAKRAHKL